MWSDPDFLELCRLLAQHNAFAAPGEGATLGRAFADLGFEEFVLLPGKKMVSLLNGQTSELTPEKEKFHFQVPSTADLVQEIEKRYYDVVSLIFEEQRLWALTVKGSRNLTERLFRGKTIENVLAQALLNIISESRPCLF